MEKRWEMTITIAVFCDLTYHNSIKARSVFLLQKHGPSVVRGRYFTVTTSALAMASSVSS